MWTIEILFFSLVLSPATSRFIGAALSGDSGTPSSSFMLFVFCPAHLAATSVTQTCNMASFSSTHHSASAPIDCLLSFHYNHEHRGPTWLGWLHKYWMIGKCTVMRFCCSGVLFLYLFCAPYMWHEGALPFLLLQNDVPDLHSLSAKKEEFIFFSLREAENK